MVGKQQAERLVASLAAVRIHRILSSPTARCVQSVEPLAQLLAIPVEATPDLGPDGTVESLLQMMVALEAKAGLLCTHGERMRPLLAQLRSNRVPIVSRHVDDDEYLLAKGTLWRSTLDSHGTIASVEHVVPDSLRQCARHA